MINRLLLIAMLSLSLHAQAEEVFTLEGYLPQVPDSTKIELLFVHSSLGQYATWFKNGQFTFHGAIDRPTEALLMMQVEGKRTETKMIYLDTGYYKVVGDTGLVQAALLPSVINQQYEEYKKYINQNYSMPSGQLYSKFIKNNPASYFSLVALEEMAGNSLNNMDEVEVLFNTLDTALKNSKTAFSFLEWMARARMLKPGQKVPTLTAKDRTGKTVSLATLRGKYVLLHFWASWCPACRNETPALKALHTKYKGKGLQVLNVSLDDNAHVAAWEKAIVKDGTGAFINVRSDQGEVLRAFNIKAIPLNLVIDPDGKIITSEVGTAGIEKAVTAIYASRKIGG